MLLPNKKEKNSEVPRILKPFVRLGWEFDPDKMAGDNFFGECYFCGKEDHFHVHPITGQWDCKSCFLKGNTFTYMRKWYEQQLLSQNNTEILKKFKLLANDRKLSVDTLKEAGIVYDGGEFIVPTFNQQHEISTLQFYNFFGRIPYGKKKRQFFSLPCVPLALSGTLSFFKKENNQATVFITAGKWDEIALNYLFGQEGYPAIVLSVPGELTWKAEWTDFVVGRNVVICYDTDSGGQHGTEKLYGILKDKVASVNHIKWPEGLPDGYDVRDYITGKECSLEGFLSFVSPCFTTEEKYNKIKEEIKTNIRKKRIKRPTWEQLVATFSKHIHITQDYQDAMKVAFATMITTAIPGDPLWVNLVGSPGSGKTLLIDSLAGAEISISRSNIGSKELCSGFERKRDPSLLPKLEGKCFLLKDGTELYSQNSIERDAILSVLRGIFDETLSRSYGNGVSREYKVHFNMIVGVTNIVYGKRSAAVGERFVFYHLKKVKGEEAKNPIRAAIRSVRTGANEKLKTELLEVATAFLNVNIDLNSLPILTERQEDIIIYLSEMVSVLRASVDRDKFRDNKLALRPETEIGTRIAKQLTKLVIGLALLKEVPIIDEEDLKIAARVAFHTCIGFNLEVVGALLGFPGQTMLELQEECDLPAMTLKDQVADLLELKAVYKVKHKVEGREGRPADRYFLSEDLKAIFKGANLSRIDGEIQYTIEQLKKKGTGLKCKVKKN